MFGCFWCAISPPKQGEEARYMVKITQVEKGSYADRAKIKAGDVLVAINGNEINDVLDYRFYLTEKKVKLVLTDERKKYTAVIKKGEYDDIGLDFETPLMDKKHSCKNGCIFCFIDQNPEGLRDSLYFKDDDSRLSFIHGNYITLTNMSDSDIDRIIKMRFSPINISVHTTNPELRVKMMKNKRSGEVLGYLRRIADAGISMCGQIVLCRGVNDGDELARSLRDLSEYFPSMSSVAIVPAGLTKFRDGLYPLTDFNPDEASAVIDAVNEMGDRMKELYGTRVFYAADEFYLKSGRAIPDADYYEEYSQIENGVGMLRSFMDEYELAYADIADMRDSIPEKRKISVATAAAAYPMILRVCQNLMKIIKNLEIKVYEIKNKFYGESITVSGLLTGKDMYEQLSDRELGSELLIPENCLRDGEDVFLCGMTLSELSERLSVKITPAESDGYEFVRRVLGADGE